MGKFALDLLFMHGHFVNPAALIAAGLLPGATGEPVPKAAPVATPARVSEKTPLQPTRLAHG